jgi:hypothetical protein
MPTPVLVLALVPERLTHDGGLYEPAARMKSASMPYAVA